MKINKKFNLIVIIILLIIYSLILSFLMFYPQKEIYAIKVGEYDAIIPKEIFELDKYYDSIPNCTYNLTDKEIQYRIDTLIYGTKLEKYKSARELELLSNKAIPLLINNVDRQEFIYQFHYIAFDFSDFIIEPIFEPQMEILSLITLENFDELPITSPLETEERNILISKWKTWYEKNKDYLVCDPITGRVIVAKK